MTFIVKIIENPTQLNCFGHLLRTATSTPSSHTFGVVHCTQIHANNPVSFVLQVFGEQAPFNFIQINPTFARVLGVAADDELVLEAVTRLPTCSSMEIYPDSFEDWNVIESTAVVIEDLFLNQIRIIQSGMRFVLFVSQNVWVTFRVLSTTPCDAPEGAVVASDMTEVLVAPRISSKKSSNTQYTPSKTFAEKLHENNAESTRMIEQITRPIEHLRKLRVLSQSLINIDFQHLNFGNQNYIIALNENRASRIQKSLIKVKSGLKQAYEVMLFMELPQSSCNEYIQEVIDLLNKYPNHCIKSIDSELFSEFTTVKINYLTPSDVNVVKELQFSVEPMPSTSEFHASDISVKKLSTFLNKVYDCDAVYLPIIVPNDGIVVNFPMDDTSIVLRIRTNLSTADCNIFWPDKIPKLVPTELTVELKGLKKIETIKKTAPITNFGASESSKTALQNQENQIASICEEISTLVDAELECRMLLIGHNGSGRSTLLKLIARKCFTESCVFSSFIDCNHWKSKPIESIETELTTLLKYLKTRKPSILFLDNVDFVNVNHDDEDRSKFISKLFNRIAVTLFGFPDVSIVATGKSIHDLPRALMSVDSRRLFDTVFEVEILNQDDKINVVKRLLKTHQWSSDVCLSTEEIAMLEGLTLADLVKLAQRAELYLCAKEESNVLDAFHKAVATIPSIGKRITKSTNTVTIKFDDVGGLEDVKQKLREVFIWPSKYGSLFAKCGLRLGGGAVLHGPSGCGKTLLTRAIGAESALNVIEVKGPELLSKYIGASEQNVRELFSRARQTKPCLIIFDEFDSLAPKRGHDSTGVTDRVVNQLLTELDGIDSANEGVYVLAATNRMDLIDGALLRPGRFDHKICVDPPTNMDRAATLRILCRELESIASDIDFDAIAAATNGYTGVDLRGLVLTAQFEAIDEATKTESTPIVTMQHLWNALSQQKGKNKEHGGRERGHPVVGTRATLA